MVSGGIEGICLLILSNIIGMMSVGGVVSWGYISMMGGHVKGISCLS